MLEEYLKKIPETLKRDLDKNLCVCNEIPRLKVIQAIIDGAHTREAVIAATYASDGTGCCKRQVEQLITHLTKPDNEEAWIF